MVNVNFVYYGKTRITDQIHLQFAMAQQAILNQHDDV